MIWNGIKNILLFPVTWFWNQYQKCQEEKAIAKMIALFVFSLTGLVSIAVLLVAMISFLINFFTEHSEMLLIVLVIIWIYLYGKSKMIKNEEQNQQLLIQQKQDMTAQNEQALQGYPALANSMYQVLRGIAEEIDSRVPCMIAEIEMPTEKYILRNNVCFYQFMAVKKDPMKLYEQDMLDEFKKTVQFCIHNKLHSGAFPSIVMEDYKDQYGNSYDGIMIDRVEDFGRYFQITAVYSSPEYADYVHNRNMMQMQRSPVEGDISVSWKDKP